MSTRPIGVYDSGIGGLSVLTALQRQLPHENFIYFADTAHLPYGDKTPEQIIAYSRAILERMEKAEAKLVVAACHTSSALALPTLVSEFSFPIVGTIDPLVETLDFEKNTRLGILATPATAASRVHERIFRQHGFKGEIVTISCPEFVPLIEAGLELGHRDCTRLKECARCYLEPFLDRSLDTLIYGCTHYPLIAAIIEPLLPKTVQFVDPAYAIARQTEKTLKNQAILNISASEPSFLFECTTDPTVFQKKRQALQMEMLSSTRGY